MIWTNGEACVLGLCGTGREPMSVGAMVFAGLVGSIFGGQSNTPPILTIPAPVSVPHISADTHPRSMSLARLTATIPYGTIWAHYRPRLGVCMLPPRASTEVTWTGNAKSFSTESVKFALASDLKAAGLKVTDDPDNLFAQDQHPDLLLAGNVKLIEGDLCSSLKIGKSTRISNADGSTGFTYDYVQDPDQTTGTVAMTIE
jgi:hypothetical protein